jgi:hypothetical protein
MGHVTVMVPEGHAIQVHPPGSVQLNQAGMIHDPMAVGARREMDKVLSKKTKVTKKGGFHDGAQDGPVNDSER